MKFIHITDTHFVAEGRTLYGANPQARLRAAIDGINAGHGDAAFAVITGDLAHAGEPAAYRALRNELDRLAIPYHLLVGNHDRRRALRAAFPELPADPDGFVQYVLDTAAGAFVMLDTLDEGSPSGLLCDGRLAWLRQTLAARRDRAVYLFLHHPPFATGIPAMDAIGLADPEALRRLVVAHGGVRHMFFGHVHRPIHGAWNGIPFSTHRATNHQVSLTFGPTNGAVGSFEPPAYGIVFVSADGVVIHTHDYLDDSPTFRLADGDAAAAPSIEALRRLAPSG